MGVFSFTKCGKSKYIDHKIETYSEFQWVTVLSSEMSDSVIPNILEVMVIMGIYVKINTDSASAYMSTKVSLFCIL